jgi:hypothetical protein
VSLGVTWVGHPALCGVGQYCVVCVWQVSWLYCCPASAVVASALVLIWWLSVSLRLLPLAACYCLSKQSGSLASCHHEKAVSLQRYHGRDAAGVAVIPLVQHVELHSRLLPCPRLQQLPCACSCWDVAGACQPCLCQQLPAAYCVADFGDDFTGGPTGPRKAAPAAAVAPGGLTQHRTGCCAARLGCVFSVCTMSAQDCTYNTGVCLSACCWWE